jgi:hypothetical protein
MFGLCEYTYQARNLLIETYMQHLGMNFLQGNYAQAILQQGTKTKKRLQITFCFVLWRKRCNRIFIVCQSSLQLQ